MFRYGVINDGGTKKVMRPHQYHALQAAISRLKEKDSGVIWHSQGSGKSLTMVWLAKYIRRTFSDPRVLIVTDRTELDMQINNTFLGASESIHRAKHPMIYWILCRMEVSGWFARLFISLVVTSIPILVKRL